MDNLETEIKDELLKEKFVKIFNKNKFLIVFLSIFICLVPIVYQIYFFKLEKNNEKYLSEYLKAISLIETDNKKALKIFENLRNSNNETIIVLSINKLLENYLKKNQINNAISVINSNLEIQSIFLSDLIKIKKALLLFDNIKEDEILNLLNLKNNNFFKDVKTKILIDFYEKNNQLDKANQIKKIK